jgi:NAD(P)-dependent dehydrogenase (short-subunit alcohol dehydrogenase family)
MAITTNTRVVVLGGTSGIGLATAKAAACAGVWVVVGSRDPARVKSAVAELATGSEGHSVDARSSEEQGVFFDHDGDFDHLAYTAADNLVPCTLDVYTPEQGRAFLELRVIRALEAVRLAVPHLRAGGSVSLTSGTAAYRGGAGWFLGSAASGAVVSAARSLAVEAGAHPDQRRRARQGSKPALERATRGRPRNHVRVGRCRVAVLDFGHATQRTTTT